MKWNRKTKADPKPKSWQLQEAKAKFSEVFELALTSGPQYVTRRNRDEVVISKRSEFERTKSHRPHIVDLLLAAPKTPGFKIRRSGQTGRKPPKFN